MAKKRQAGVKAAVVELMAENPTASATELVDLMTERGFDVQKSSIYNIRNQLRKANESAPRRVRVTPAGGDQFSISSDDLRAVKTLSTKFGGIKRLREVVSELAEILE